MSTLCKKLMNWADNTANNYIEKNIYKKKAIPVINNSVACPLLIKGGSKEIHKCLDCPWLVDIKETNATWTEITCKTPTSIFLHE